MPLVNIPSFLKGINEEYNENLIAFDEAIICKNVDVRDGSLSSCYGTGVVYDCTSPINIYTLMTHFEGDYEFLLGCSEDKVYEIGSRDVGVYYPEWKEIASGFHSFDFDFINYQSEDKEQIIFGNGIDNTKVWDGKTIRDLKFKGYSSAVATDNKAPKGKYIELHRERLWIAGSSEHPNMVYFSSTMDADDFTTPIAEGEANQHGGFIDVPTWDGGIIVGIKPIFDDMLIFKTHKVFKIYGADIPDFTLALVFDAIDGTINDRTVASMHNMAFWTTDNGIYAYDGVNVEMISRKLQKTWKRFDMTRRHMSRAVIYDNKYILSLPVDEDTSNMIIIEYDILNKSFIIKEDIKAMTFVHFDDELLYANSDSSKVYGYKNPFQSLQGGMWENGLSNLGLPNEKKNVSILYLIASGEGDIEITVKTEKKEKTKILTLTENPTEYRFKIKNKGRLVGLRIRAIDNATYKIVNPALFYEGDED